MPSRYYRLEGRRPVGSETFHLQPAEDRRVALTLFPGVRVSTVFLGIDHRFDLEGPPLLFETLVSGGAHDELMRRYASWEEAEQGHAEIVALVSSDAPPILSRYLRNVL
jgi:hypothetical protein